MEQSIDEEWLRPLARQARYLQDHDPYPGEPPLSDAEKPDTYELLEVFAECITVDSEHGFKEGDDVATTLAKLKVAWDKAKENPKTSNGELGWMMRGFLTWALRTEVSLIHYKIGFFGMRLKRETKAHR